MELINSIVIYGSGLAAFLSVAGLLYIKLPMFYRRRTNLKVCFGVFERKPNEDYYSTGTPTTEKMESLFPDIDGASKSLSSLEQDVDNIMSILDTVSAIAEQTNLLALNTAVEAARSAEKGRGFAGVANEVRLLAQRTTQSTEELSTSVNLIRKHVTELNYSIEKTCAIGKKTEQNLYNASKSLSEISASFSEISEMNNLIKQAAKEQSYISPEISGAIQSITEQTESMKNLTDETNSSLFNVFLDHNETAKI